MIEIRKSSSIHNHIYWWAFILIALASPSTFAQVPPSNDYYEICRKLGYVPGTGLMRRCIQEKRGNDLDPLNALVEYDLIPPAAHKPQSAGQEESAEFSGAKRPIDVLERTPEELLMGPEYRAPYQGIYE